MTLWGLPHRNEMGDFNNKHTKGEHFTNIDNVNMHLRVALYVKIALKVGVRITFSTTAFDIHDRRLPHHTSVYISSKDDSMTDQEALRLMWNMWNNLQEN